LSPLLAVILSEAKDLAFAHCHSEGVKRPKNLIQLRVNSERNVGTGFQTCPKADRPEGLFLLVSTPSEIASWLVPLAMTDKILISEY
jgi:hypothetical protein